MKKKKRWGKPHRRYSMILENRSQISRLAFGSLEMTGETVTIILYRPFRAQISLSHSWPQGDALGFSIMPRWGE
jgi:hypothetical protein